MKKGSLVAIGLVVALVAFGVWRFLQPEATLEVVSPTVRTVRVYVEEQAVTELPHDYLISMPISGWLEPIILREGDEVSKDQVVARLEEDDLKDRVHQAEQRIEVLQTQIAELSDNRLEDNALVEVEATVKAIDETVAASEAKLEASRAVLDFAQSESKRLGNLVEASSAATRELNQAQMEFRRSRAEYEGDKLELAALKTIAAVSYIGPKFIKDYIDRKSFSLDQRDKELAEARTQLRIEQRNLERAEVKSPIDGVVLERHETRRQFLAAGTPLLTLGRLDDMEVVAEVLTERATRLTPGDPVDVFGRAIPDGPIMGHVLRIYPAGFKKISSLGVEQQRVKVAIELDARPERLGTDFRVYVRIYYGESAHATALPRSSLFRSNDGGWNVMVVRAGRTELRTVSVGLMNDDWAEITDGVTTDDVVVLRPSREIVPGMRVATTHG